MVWTRTSGFLQDLDRTGFSIIRLSWVVSRQWSVVSCQLSKTPHAYLNFNVAMLKITNNTVTIQNLVTIFASGNPFFW